MANSSLRVTELDYNNIVNNLTQFLSGQPTFSDYNFQGSALSTIVKLLAYDTHYNAVLANMLGNEMFLDSAITKASVVSKAKELNYTPRSNTCAKAIVNITVHNVLGNPASITLPKYTQFTSSVNGVTYSFITNSEYYAPNVANTYTFSNVVLYQGTYNNITYLVGNDKFYEIPDNNVDISTLSVLVQQSSSNLNANVYTLNTDISAIDGNSLVYFLQGYKDSSYQLYFGDDVLGKKLINGNIIIAQYLTTSGSLANSAITFKLSGTIAGSSSIAITTITAAYGGNNAESIDDIRANAPKAFTAQNRMITPDDYEVLLKQNYSNIKSISVWGGEDNTPPDYGIVYICIEPLSTDFLSIDEKNYIKNGIINSRKNIGIVPKIVDPLYVYIKIKSTVYYNSNLTSLSSTDLASSVKTVISNYNTNNLEKFKGVFRYSPLCSAIDISDKSIVSNITTFSLHQYLVPVFGKSYSYTLNFYNPIYKNEFGTPENSFSTSRGFRILGDTTTYYLEDDGKQYIRMYYLSNTTKVYVNDNAGTIDYNTGKIVINSINITSIDYVNNTDPGLEILVIPQSNDVIPKMNMIVSIKDNDIITNAIIDPISTGANTAGTDYTFTPSR